MQDTELQLLLKIDQSLICTHLFASVCLRGNDWTLDKSALNWDDVLDRVATLAQYSVSGK